MKRLALILLLFPALGLSGTIPGWDCNNPSDPGKPDVTIDGVTAIEHCLPVVEGQTAAVSLLPLLAPGGDLVATYAGQGAAGNDTVFFNGTALFNNFTSRPGDSVNLGTFQAGTPLLFTLSSSDGYTWGLGVNPADGLSHAAYAPWPGGTFLGFEDLPNCGDCDYNDMMVVVTRSAETPEIASWFAVALGLSVIFRKRSHES